MAKLDRPFSISVVVPVYWPAPSVDRIALLRRALRSIHDQSYVDGYEIVLVDDGCPVSIESIKGKIGPALFQQTRVVRGYRNNGLVHALNLGLASARYNWIARLDADDQWCPRKIERQIALIRGDKDLSICATGMELVDGSGQAFETHVRSGRWGDILSFMSDVGCPFPHGSILARADIFKLIGGYSHDVAISHCEDYALWGVWLRFFKPIMVEDVLMKYTVSTMSVSGRNRLQQVEASKIVARKFKELAIVQTLPQDLQALASRLCCSMLTAGKITYLMWRFGIPVIIPREAIDVLQRILPDRKIEIEQKRKAFRLCDIDEEVRLDVINSSIPIVARCLSGTLVL